MPSCASVSTPPRPSGEPDPADPRAVAAGVLACAGRELRAADAIDLSGADPVFRTPYRIATAGAAALGALGVALSDLWRLRTGRTQAVSVDLRAAAASLRGNTYVRRDGEKPISWDPLTGHYATKDGRHYFLHTNHVHHRQGALRVAGCATEDREALAAAIARRDALEFEAAIDAAGCVGGMTRTPEEWAAHPHAATIAALPLLQLVKIGDAPPEPLPAGDRPLAGIRVLDLTRVLAGPTAGRMLAEQGADVMHVTAPHLPYQDELLMDTGHGKRCASLDLRDPAAVETLRGLVREAHVFSQGYRPGTLARRGFSPEALAALRPGLVCVQLSAYGDEGAWAGRRGFDSIVQNVTGMAATQGSLAAPRNLPVQALDYIAGYLGAFVAAVALARRATEGGSWLAKVSLVQVAHWVKGLGTVDVARGAAELAPDELAQLTMQSTGPLGRIEHLAPVLKLSETPGRYARPAEPRGASPASWR